MPSSAHRESSHRPAPRNRPTGPKGAWKCGPIPVVGLVGGIGAGKSSIAKELAQAGAHLLDADAIGHTLLDQKPAREQVVARFGAGVLSSSEPDQIDRQALGRIVFADRAALQALEAILHPLMRHSMEKAIARLSRRRVAKAIVIDAAILYEAGWDALCDMVVFVDAPEAQRADRLQSSRGWSLADLKQRESFQWPLETKRAKADLIVLNDTDAETLARAVDEIWALTRKRRRAGGSVYGSQAKRDSPAAPTTSPVPGQSPIKTHTNSADG